MYQALDDLWCLLMSALGCWFATIVYRRGFSDVPRPPRTIAVIVLSGAIWWSLFWIQKEVSWWIWRGRGLAHGYGWDKELPNFILEPLLVIILTALLNVITRRFARRRYTRGVAVALAATSAAAVVLAIPALPE